MKTYMKIVILTDVYLPYLGGGQIYLSNVVRNLCKRTGVEIEIVTRKLIVDGKTSVKNESGYDGRLKITRLGFRAEWNNIFARLSYIFLSIFYLLNKNFDLIDAQAFIGGIPGKIASIIKRKPVILTVHGTSLEIGRAGILEKLILTKIKYNIIISAASNFLKFKNNNKNISIVNPGVDTSFYKPDLSKRVPDRILFVGRLQKIKGTETLFNCISKTKHLNYKWAVVGDGEEMNNLKNKTKTSHIRDVEFKGSLSREKVLEEYRKASVFFLPSESEGFPLTLLEAMSCGLPCVASSVGDAPKIIENGKNGFTVSPGNVSKFIEKIQLVMKNRSLLKQMTENNIAKSKNYSWDETANKIYKIYKQI